MSALIRHAFLTPGHNCWSLWTSAGSTPLVSEGSTHRVLETLVFAIDKMTSDGWRVQNVFVEQGAPTLVLLAREEEAI